MSTDRTPLLKAEDGSPKPSPHIAPKATEHLSRNVPKTFFYNFFDGASFSVWQSQVLQVLVYKLDGNQAVGWVSGVAGVAQVVAALIAGYSADVLPKHHVCRVAALCGLMGVISGIAAVYSLSTKAFFISSAIWGIYMGLANCSSEALFADSVPSGQRAAIYNWKWIVQILCFCVGYIMCLILFARLDNHWHVDVMQTIMYAGFGIHPIALGILSWLHSDDALKHDKSFAEKRRLSSRSLPDDAIAGMPEEQDTSGSDGDDGKGSQPETKEPTAAEAAQQILSHLEETRNPYHKDGDDACVTVPSWLTWKKAPYFICAGDFVMALGSGMTMRFIPLFFVNDYNITPTLLMGVYLIISVVTSIAALIVRHLAERYLGRLPSILAIRLVGTSLLLYLAVVPQNTSASSLAVMLAVFVTRNACMNCTLGMSRSVIMDFCDKSSRAKWSAMESFANFTWAGSATLGGYLANAHGYKYTFLITACVHYFGCSLLIPAWASSRRLENLVMLQQQERREREAEKKKLKACQDQEESPCHDGEGNVNDNGRRTFSVRTTRAEKGPSVLSIQQPDNDE